MSSIIFGYTMSLATAATPSNGFLVAYDSDGIIKQKDSAGVITPIGGGPTPGLMGTFSLAEVLAYSNDSEVYSILMGTATSILVGNSGSIDMASASTIYMGTASSILSNNGLSAFYLDYSTATSSVYLTNGYNYLSIDNATMSLINNLSGTIDISNVTNYVKLSTFNEIFSTSEIRLRVYNASNEIMIKANIGSSASSPNSLSNAIFIGTQNSIFDSNITNSVILGGYGQQAIASDSVYVPDLYIQNGKRLRGSLGNGSVNFTDTNDIIIENSESTLALITSSSSTILSTNGIIIADTLTQISSPNMAASPVFISTRDSVIAEGVHNTVIIGGENLIASLTNSVVLGEFVNINNSYTLPNVDGASGSYLTTDGSGNVTWQMTPPEVQNLESVLTIGNNTGYNSIEMGTGSSIYSIRGGGQINLDFAPDSVVISTDNGSLSKAYIQLDDEDIIIDTNENLNIAAGTASVIVANGEGLVYGFDYSATFVTYSLVTKGYVDSIVNSVGAENGLVEITSGTFGLGGTISQDTTINGNGYTFSLSSFNKLIFTASQTNTQFSSLNLGDGFILSTSDGIQSNYLQSGYLSDISIVNVDPSGTSSVVEAGTSGPAMYINDNAIQSIIQIYTFDNTIGSGDGSSNNRMVITDEFASKGLVYYDDYSANFTTYSLVTKGYVDTQVATSTSKYSEVRSFTASVTETINHNLGTDEIIVQAYESTGIMAIPGTVQINGSNDVDITFSKTLSNIKIVIIG